MSEERSDGRPPYVLALTHDVDLPCLSALPGVGRILSGFVFRNILDNAWRVVTGRLGLRSYLRGVSAAFLSPLSFLGILPDPLSGLIRAVKEKEQELGVRSTFYFVPRRAHPGVQPDGRAAPPARAVYYDLQEMKSLIHELQDGGWEIGVHGIDSYRDLHSAKDEHDALGRIVVRTRIGHRSHWLYSKETDSWDILSTAGYAYDSSYGWNDKVGWPGGRKWPFRPFTRKSFVVLPLNVQDKALMGRPLQQAWKAIRTMLCDAKRHGGILTVLWHPSSFGPPRYLGNLYESIIHQAQADQALILTAEQAIAFWRNKGEPGG